MWPSIWRVFRRSKTLAEGLSNGSTDHCSGCRCAVTMAKAAGHMALMLLLRKGVNLGGLPEPGHPWLMGSGPPSAYGHMARICNISKRKFLDER